MVNRRKFVALLSLVPLIGTIVLAVWLRPEDHPPPGFVQCNVCREFNGRLTLRAYQRTVLKFTLSSKKRSRI